MISLNAVTGSKAVNHPTRLAGVKEMVATDREVSEPGKFSFTNLLRRKQDARQCAPASRRDHVRWGRDEKLA